MPRRLFFSAPRWNEALHGVAGDGAASAISLGSSCFEDPAPPGKQKCATSFPAAITTASSYNHSLTRSIGAAIGTEARVFSNLGLTGLTFCATANRTAHTHLDNSRGLCFQGRPT